MVDGNACFLALLVACLAKCFTLSYTPGSSMMSFAVVQDIVIRLVPVLWSPGHAPVLRSMLRNTSNDAEPPLAALNACADLAADV